MIEILFELRILCPTWYTRLEAPECKDYDAWKRR
jgi:hypothetical protein